MYVVEVYQRRVWFVAHHIALLKLHYLPLISAVSPTALYIDYVGIVNQKEELLTQGRIQSIKVNRQMKPDEVKMILNLKHLV